MDSRNISIAIVGAGASGTILASQIIGKVSTGSDARIDVFLIEKGNDFGPGLAYSTPLASHILNMRADTLGAESGNPLHFVEWLREQNEYCLMYETSGGFDINYPPRKMYGKYLKTVLDSTIKKTGSGSGSVNLIRGEAVDINQDGDSYQLQMANGDVIPADNIILAPGNFPGSFLYELKGVNGYIPYPWPVSEIMGKIPRDDPVFILGAGLSAIDTFFTLMENDHRGKITFISRRGLLPKVQGMPFEYEPKFICKEKMSGAISETKGNSISLDLIKELFFKEMETAEGREIDWLRVFNPMGSTAQILKKDISRAEAGMIPYQAALTSSGPITGYIWNSMSIEDRMHFDRIYKTLWTVYRHPMPIINAKKILNALNTGQLTVESGLMCVRTCGEKGFEMDVSTRFGIPYTFKTPFIINATGQGTDVARFNNTLLNRLLDKGIINPHPNGGINADFNTGEVIGKNGRNIPGLFALGEITRGVHFFTNGVVPNMVNSEKIADRIISKNKD